MKTCTYLTFFRSAEFIPPLIDHYGPGRNKFRAPKLTCRECAPCRAFTLIELVIGASLMSIILTGAYLCLNAGMMSQKLVETRGEALQTARVALALMTADLRSACLLDKEYQFLGMRRMLGEIPADNLDFATHNYRPRRPREGDFCEISYFLDKDPITGQIKLWRRRNPTLAPDPLSGGHREEIARDVRGLRFEFYDGLEWYDSWGDVENRRRQQNSNLAPANLSGLPEAVRITLWLDPNPAVSPAAPAEKTTQEPPMQFQTIARLNLAAISSSGGATSASSATNNAAGNPAGPTPPGPTR